MRKLIILVGFSVLLMQSFNIHAVDWPGTGDCAGSLPSCIAAQPDPGFVTVKTNSLALSGGTITINQNLTLTAGISFHPILRDVTVNVTVGNGERVSIRGFEFEQESIIIASVTTDAELNIESNNWTFPSTTASENEGIRVSSSVAAGEEGIVNITGNNLIGANNSTLYGLLDIVHSNAGRLKLNIHDNHITVLDLDVANSEAVYIINNGSGIMDLQFVANEVRGAQSQLRVTQSNTSAVFNVGIVSNLLTGVIDANNVVDLGSSTSAVLSNVVAGSFTGFLGNNTIDGVKRAGGLDGTGLNFSGHTTTGSSLIRVLNNIIVNTDAGYDGPASGTSTSVVSYGNNVFLNHGTLSGLTIIASDVNAPPRFIEEGINYALSSTSPAIDRAASVGSAIFYELGFMTGAPRIDADGLRRYKGPMVDSGAYEWGDRHIFHRTTNPSGQVSQPIADSALNGNAAAMTVVTQIWSYDNSSGVYNNHQVGIYRAGAQWRIFNEDLDDMPVDAKFHVYYPYGDISDDLNGLTTWQAPAATGTGFELESFDLNNNPDAGVFVTNFWQGVYNPHPLEIGYKTSNGKWYLGSADGADMPAGALFMTYDQDASRNVFHHNVTADNTSGHITTIDHPLLNGNPCALPTVTQSTTWFIGPLFEQNPNNIGAYYASGRWRIFNQNFNPINVDIGGPIIGGRFNVMVDPQQAYVCNDIIFKDNLDD